MFTCERIMKRVIDITGVACESVKSLQYTKDKSASSPKELCTLLLSKLEEGGLEARPLTAKLRKDEPIGDWLPVLRKIEGCSLILCA